MAENEKVIDYGALLADLEARRAVLDSAISSLRAAVAAGAIGAVEGTSYVNLGSTVVNRSIHNGEIPAGAFLGKSIPEAAKLYLSIAKKKQTTKEIADALREGGMETNSKNFEVTVGTGLYRVSRSAGDIVKLKGAWGLAEWYPAGMRLSHGKHERPKTRKVKKSKPRQSKLLTLPEKTESTIANELARGRFLDGLVEMLKDHPSQEFTRKEISGRFGVNPRVVAMIMGTLIKKGLVVRSAPDAYRAVQS